MRAALTIPETLAGLAAGAVSLAVLVPVLAQVGHSVPVLSSWNNLREIHTALECYAADWNNRQFTGVPDDLGVAGGSCGVYANEIGCFPPLFAGVGCNQTWWAYWAGCETIGGVLCSGAEAIRPIRFDPELPFGIFRVPQVKPVHDYLGGRFYDPVFFSPLDHKAYDAAFPAFAVDCEFVEDVGTIPSSYCFSPAAMYHPDVMRAPSAGGFQDPETLDHGFASPSLGQARYPALKTWMLEHNWLRDPPGACHPEYVDPFGGFSPECDPYLFNHGADAEPLTLFYDGSIESLGTGDVAADDARVLKQSGGVDGLWSRDTPFGELGYFGEFTSDGTVVSHHVLTTGGILGRDRLPRPAPKGGAR